MGKPFFQNLTVEGFVELLAGLAQISTVTLIPLLAGYFAWRATAKIWIASHPQKILSEPGRYIWKISVSTSRRMVRDVSFLIRSHSTLENIDLVSFESKSRNASIENNGSYLSVNIPVIFSDEKITIFLKFQKLDHPIFESMSKGVRINSVISWPKGLVKKAILLTSQQRLMMLMLNFMLATVVIIAAIFVVYFRDHY